jgi:agmatine/peptidylarginine deiminase
MLLTLLLFLFGFGFSNLPIETDPVGSLIISIDDMNLQNQYVFNLWTTVIKSAQRQDIDVIAYLLNKYNNLDIIKDNLQLEDIDVSNILFIDDYYTDTIWIRDYGPVLFYNQYNNLTVFDPLYFKHRNFDDNMPYHFAKRFHLNYIKSDLRIEGGNLLSNGKGKCIVSDKVLKYNKLKTLQEELGVVGCKNIIIMKSLKYDRTQHIDMWLFILDEYTVIMGIYETYQDLQDHNIMLENYHILKENEFTILLMPMPSHCHNGTDKCPIEDYVSRSYMNVLPLNDEIIVPVYNLDKKYEKEALYKWHKYTKKKIIPVEADLIIRDHGAIHCITRTGPRIIDF